MEKSDKEWVASDCTKNLRPNGLRFFVTVFTIYFTRNVWSARLPSGWKHFISSLDDEASSTR